MLKCDGCLRACSKCSCRCCWREFTSDDTWSIVVMQTGSGWCLLFTALTCIATVFYVAFFAALGNADSENAIKAALVCALLACITFISCLLISVGFMCHRCHRTGKYTEADKLHFYWMSLIFATAVAIFIAISIAAYVSTSSANWGSDGTNFSNVIAAMGVFFALFAIVVCCANSKHYKETNRGGSSNNTTTRAAATGLV